MGINKIKLQRPASKKIGSDKSENAESIESAKIKLKNQNNLLDNILNSLTHPFLIIDAYDHTIKKYNRMASSEDLPAGTTCYQLTYGSNKPCIYRDRICPVAQIKKTKKPIVVEHIHRNRDGEQIVYEAHCFPIFGVTGDVKEVIEYLHDITKRKKTEEKLQEIHSRLVTEQVALRGKNIALKEIMKQMDDEKKCQAHLIQSNINRTIMPILRKLEEKTGPLEKGYIKLLENSLSEITDPFISQLERQFTLLSPREIEISNMIRNGLTSKDIAGLLDISDQTVIKHRKKIRKKLEIDKQKINLVSHLKSLPTSFS